MKSGGTKFKVGMVVVVVLLVVCVAAVYVITRPAEKPPEEGGAGKPGFLEMPIQEITNALAAREGVSTENVEIQFCELASETDNDHFAAGAIVGGSKSIVIMFENSTGQITVENEYTASTANELSAMSITKRELSKWTGNKVVAGWFQSATGGYTFMYYDGYSTRFQRWLFGYGTVYIDNRSVVWSAHSV
ncbi:MAG: hypothetical protein COT21_03170 [Hadesarchaea archaeon CG08_land_8_20_14_0_20_51_8]|nr:MAG: hypothetical protein COT21_03170 [Hadesarchaea archaeon CG08_land_8_20_14_0_20_51_8]